VRTSNSRDAGNDPHRPPSRQSSTHVFVRTIKGSQIPVVLSIAGSDSGGGAGIQADLRVFARLGVFGTTAITAITAQNTMGVSRVSPINPDMVRAQIDAVTRDLEPRVMKSGMLANAGIVHAVAAAIRDYRSISRAYVLDPVMIASSGETLLEIDAVTAVRDELLPLADLVTPNLDEARALTGVPVSDVRGMARAAQLLVDQWGARAALVTGGHLTGPSTADVLYDGTLHHFKHRRIDARHTHGTGCTLSAAITAFLALGEELPVAVGSGIRYVRRAIRQGLALGSGAGPVG
jgi:hydroxymethylpyrimidine kinase/phosphomethylpyrimidine kinase